MGFAKDPGRFREYIQRIDVCHVIFMSYAEYKQDMIHIPLGTGMPLLTLGNQAALPPIDFREASTKCWLNSQGPINRTTFERPSSEYMNLS